DDPRWDTNGNGPGTVHGALTLAIITWVGNRAAGATTHSAWARECESAAVFTSKTSTATVRTRSGLAGFRTGTMTGCTRCLTGKLQRNGGSDRKSTRLNSSHVSI